MNIKSSPLYASAREASGLLAKLAHPARLMIVCHLLEGEAAVGALAQAVGLRQATTSQHLAQLREDALVSTRREGQTIYYKLAPGPVRGILKVLAQHYCKEE